MIRVDTGLLPTLMPFTTGDHEDEALPQSFSLNYNFFIINNK